ncbi:MAG: hypothetical protein WBQ72_19815 [Terriglobales bacterium]|jgi:hypothetical protein
MYLLKSVDIWSCAKIAGVLYAFLGLLLIPMVLIAIMMSAGSPQPYSTGGAVALVLLAVFAPIVYGLLGFLLGALSAWLYNIAAKYVGGIRLELRNENSIVRVAPGIDSV